MRRSKEEAYDMRRSLEGKIGRLEGELNALRKTHAPNPAPQCYSPVWRTVLLFGGLLPTALALSSLNPKWFEGDLRWIASSSQFEIFGAACVLDAVFGNPGNFRR